MSTAVLDAALDRALCRRPDVDPELWFALRGSADEARARQICAACPLRPACAQAALDRRERWGIWGGLDPDQRRAATPRAPRQLRPCGTEAAHSRHLRRGETPCEPCRAAHTRNVRDHAARARARRKVNAS